MSLFPNTHLCWEILISYFSHSLGDEVMAQRTPSNTPTEAQQTASNENNIKYPVYGIKYICLMEPKWQSITSPTSFTVKLGTR